MCHTIPGSLWLVRPPECYREENDIRSLEVEQKDVREKGDSERDGGQLPRQGKGKDRLRFPCSLANRKRCIEAETAVLPAAIKLQSPWNIRVEDDTGERPG